MANKNLTRVRSEDKIQLSPVELGREVTGKLQPVNRARTINILAYSASINVDATLGDIQRLTVTNTSAFTINAPKNPDGATLSLTFEILNSSGGAMGAITWNAAYKLAGAFTNPASTKIRTIRFYYNGSSYIEECRAAADI